MQFLRSDGLQSRQSIRFATSSQFFQTRELFFLRGHNHFAANLVRDVVFTAEFHHRGGACHA